MSFYVFPLLQANALGSPVNEAGEYIERLFVPNLSLKHQRVPDARLITYSPEKQVNQLQLRQSWAHRVEPDKVSLVVFIRGDSRDEGRPTARAAWSVFFGPGSRFNSSGHLSPSLPQTSFHAEIEALCRALDTIKDICHGDKTLREIKICPNENYRALSSMIEGLEERIEKGGVRTDGQPMHHFDNLRKIHEMITQMTCGDDGGLRIQFCDMPTEHKGGLTSELLYPDSP